MSADYDDGVRDGIEYAAGFLEGAARAARILRLREFAAAFDDGARELRTATPAMVRKAAGR